MGIPGHRPAILLYNHFNFPELRGCTLNSKHVERRLAAILAADVAGSCRLIGIDEEGTLAQLKALRKTLFDPKIAEHHGRVVKNTGDGAIAEFASVVDAVRCADEIQRSVAEQNIDMPQDKRIELRIGVHVGDIVIDESDIFGDAVNIAVRLEGIAEPGGVSISDDAHRQIRGKIGIDYDDMGPQVLKNIAAPMRVWRARIGPSFSSAMLTKPPTETAQPLALPDKPSIAVLPFQNMSGDPEQEYFADGMVEEIITALSRFRQLFVIARNSTFTYKGRAVDVRQVSRDLGVRYVLEGSVRKAGSRIRITGQLIDAIGGAHLWADHFDGSLEDIFQLQDNVASSVAGVIEPALRAAELRRSVQRSTDDLNAYDLYLRARADIESQEKERVLRALDLIRQALARDPQYGSALTLAALCYQALHVNGWADDLDEVRRRGLEVAGRALQVAGDDSYMLANASFVRSYFGEDIDAAIALVDRALQLNPNLAVGWIRSGWVRAWAGQPDIAIKHFETYIRLSPLDNRARALIGIGVGHFFARRLEDARVILLRALQETPTWAPTYRFLASCYAHMGRLDEARDIVKRLREVTPVVVPSAEHWRMPKDREFYLTGLRLAAREST
jgi:TolB-like protein/class 3 adenylate cyclase